MLGHRRRRWANIKTTLAQRLEFSGNKERQVLARVCFSFSNVLKYLLNWQDAILHAFCMSRFLPHFPHRQTEVITPPGFGYFSIHRSVIFPTHHFSPAVCLSCGAIVYCLMTVSADLILVEGPERAGPAGQSPESCGVWMPEGPGLPQNHRQTV